MPKTQTPPVKMTPAATPDAPLTLLDAAAQVLAGAARPMTIPAVMAAIAERKLWTSPSGKTPAATLSAAINREIARKGDASRFTKIDRGFYAAR